MSARLSRSWRDALATRRRLRTALVIVLALAALYAAYRYTLHRMVEAKLDEIRKQGYPVTLTELDKWYAQPPPGENAADAYLDIFHHYAPQGKPPYSERRRRIAEEEASETNAPPCAPVLHFHGSLDTNEVAAVASNAEALALLRKAPLAKACRYPVDLTRPFDQRQMFHLSPIAKGHRLLTMEAMLRGDHGRTDLLAEDLEQSVALAQSLANEPCTISQGLRLRCHNRTIGALERVVSKVSFSDNALVQLTTSLAAIDNPTYMRRALVGERCDWYEVIRHTMPLITTVLLDCTGSQDRQLIGYLDGTDRVLDATRGDYPDGLHAATSLAAQLEGSHQNRFVADFIVELSGEYAQDAATCADLRCAVAALAVERYRLAHSELPQKLDGLVPFYLRAVPTDPFDGHPLRYKKLVKGYVIYSVCKDGKDDGGDEKKDITFTVER
jgi:hypothetical protein